MSNNYGQLEAQSLRQLFLIRRSHDLRTMAAYLTVLVERRARYRGFVVNSRINTSQTSYKKMISILEIASIISIGLVAKLR